MTPVLQFCDRTQPDAACRAGLTATNLFSRVGISPFLSVHGFCAPRRRQRDHVSFNSGFIFRHRGLPRPAPSCLLHAAQKDPIHDTQIRTANGQGAAFSHW
jgi:hypothetical protein